ncbi:MAG: division/cell wall cluster transcriptional repressor MraZ [Ruminococcus sp.]|nr:division/cell wall cluster transcriptional repressor MraZ [Ruminococcus sp.]MDE6783937.1 division/cell wall cluster transcriptional repressor MraZ [Ruminococcus sp.]
MNMPLCGTFKPSVDVKGRMSFPNKLREILGAEFYLCAGHEKNYIAVYSVDEFYRYCAKLNEITGEIGSEIRRELLAGADRQSPDKQGRIFISQLLRDYAGITAGEVTVIGNMNRAEIWNSEKLAECRRNVDQAARKAALANLVL